MTKRLLTLTFHAPNVLLREDALFKQHAIASSLLDGEALGDKPEDIPDKLQPDKKAGPASGLVGAQYPPTDGTYQVSLNEVGVNAWWRAGFKRKKSRPSDFEDWIKPRVEQSTTCLLLGGHHATFGDESSNPIPVVWGAQDNRSTTSSHRFFTALVPAIDTETVPGTPKPKLYVVGHPYKQGREAVVRAGPFDLDNALKDCRLIVIMGCNGVDWMEGAKSDPPGWLWQKWVESAADRKPVVLGWYGTHSMPRDEHKESFSEDLWSRFAALATKHGTDLAGLCESHAKDVIGAWGESLKATYANSSKNQKHLWYENGEGAAAIDPEGNVWKVTDANGPIRKIP